MARHHLPTDLLDDDFVRPSELGARRYRRTYRRGGHTPNAHRESVEEITERLYRQIDTSGWHLSPDGKYYIGNVTIRFPDNLADEQTIVMLEPSGGLIDIPVLATDEASADDLINEWIRRQMEGADDGQR